MTLISQKWSSDYHVKPHGSKMVITIGRDFFLNFEKGAKTVQNGSKRCQKMQKMEKIKKKKIKKMTLERDHCVKNGHFWSYVDATLVFF